MSQAEWVVLLVTLIAIITVLLVAVVVLHRRATKAIRYFRVIQGRAHTEIMRAYSHGYDDDHTGWTLVWIDAAARDGQEVLE